MHCSWGEEHSFIGFATLNQSSRTHMPIIVTFIIPIKHEFVARVIAGTLTAIGHSTILGL